MGELKAVRIMYAVHVDEPQIEGLIEKFYYNHMQKEIPEINYSGLKTYLQSTVQYGGDVMEFWVVYDMETREPIAFAHWFLRPIPYRGTVFCDFIFNSSRRKEAASLLLGEYEMFGKRHRATFYQGVAVDDLRLKIFKKHAVDKGYIVDRHNWITFVAVQDPKKKKTKKPERGESEHSEE